VRLDEFDVSAKLVVNDAHQFIMIYLVNLVYLLNSININIYNSFNKDFINRTYLKSVKYIWINGFLINFR